jgi:6-phosphofructokinase 1
MATKVFFSYSFKHHLIIEYYYSMFSKYAKDDFEIFFYEKVYHERPWDETIKTKIDETEVFVLFLGKEIGVTQEKELDYWNSIEKTNKKQRNSILVYIEDTKNSKLNKQANSLNRTIIFKEDINKKIDVYVSFEELFFSLTSKEFKIFDGLPLDIQPFNYEKDIIDFYRNKYIINKSLSLKQENIENIKKAGDFFKIEKNLKKGVIPAWPSVKINLRIEEDLDEKNEDKRKKYKTEKNPILDEIGTPRSAHVLAAALTNYHEIETKNRTDSNKTICETFCLKDHSFSFPEAGPREYIYEPINIPFNQHYNVAILVTGGIAPGINAVIDGITQRHFKYASACQYLSKLQVIGLKNGFKSFHNESDMVFLYPDKQSSQGKPNAIVTSEMINLGGCMIGTSRWDKLEVDSVDRFEELKEIIYSLKRLKINILYIIGGEGSMKAAHALHSIYDKKFPGKNDWRLNVVGIPKTMDNDILWVWQTFGFMSAVEKAREFIDYLAVETSSNPRVGIVQLFGSNSGFVVSHAVLASRTGICDFALIPESPYDLEILIPALKESLRKKQKNYGLIIMSETAIPVDAQKYLEKYKDEIRLTEKEKEAIDKYFNENRIIKGHIEDELREASFKIVKYSIKRELEDEDINSKVLTNEPRHLIRSIPPSTIDIINASRLGILAVDNAIAGYTDFMISQWLTEYCLVPLDLVVLGRKKIPKKGIFWKSVIAKTGQPEKLSKEDVD